MTICHEATKGYQGMYLRQTLRNIGVFSLFTLVVTGSAQASDYGYATISLKDGMEQTIQLSLNGPKQTLTSLGKSMYLPDVRVTSSGSPNSIVSLPGSECFTNCDRVELEAKGTTTGRVILSFNVKHKDVPRFRPLLAQSDGSFYNPEATGWTIEGTVLIRDKQVLPLVLTSSGEQVGTLRWLNGTPEQGR
ncbi:hypothetical protein JK182_08145 [Acetobacter okinawensis]|uniref:hypothetical protein n=1 Tax=Acetobacter okinawensis TaxID=1076594 RepID=UPI001BA9C324|nr:hypothetical protein [Acetobacter okinawensis]MBS0988634.1 hypothetical protein [Acetobacter okinawensis]